MDSLAAFVSWPTAPLTNRLVLDALASLPQPPKVVGSLPDHAAAPRLLHLVVSYVIRKALIRKHFLSRCIHNYLTKHPTSALNRGVPRTWELELSFADELDELWSDDLYDLANEIEKNDPAQWWILKPGMADRGMGLRLFHSKEDLEAIFQEFEQDESDAEGETADVPDTAVATSQLRHFVIQEYLAKPLLLDPSEVPLDDSPKPAVGSLHGHKFHLRVYCIASGAIKVYMYDRILALFSAVPYKERGEAGVRLLDELVGCHVLSAPQQPRKRHAMGKMMDPSERHNPRLQVSGPPVFSQDDVADLKAQISDLLAETFKAAVEMSVHFQPLPNAFELYGIDFVVTHSPEGPRHLRANILEVNSEPAIELTGPRLTWILEDLFKSISKTCVEPFFSTDGSLASEVKSLRVGETRCNLRKCLDLPVRGAQGW
ncbi:tubulin-tyrosine ligase [Epithele typhae]|uniref:tubulin-tyrosine ligase n=1 Tax=Epithele typhae TaxID=378194 RepID=UPI002008B7CA|nr:tubulin-tyrosine ligase [Epithele typhae]KAH9944474.1 tubulin-tyrosine ligase [Epithele typhae]